MKNNKQTVVDLHSHILPGIDDGSHSLEESISMLQMEADQGIYKVVATPHFYPRHDTPTRFLQRRKIAELQLREVMAQHANLPELYIGAEVHYFRGISDAKVISELTIDEKKHILIEMPHMSWNDLMYRELEAIYTNHGLIPIIAHIDRYLEPFHSNKIMRKLAELPVLVQANAEFFLNKRTAKMALRMLKNDQIHFLGSDCHNLSDRSPNLKAAVELICKHLGDETIERIQAYENNLLGI